jgi:DNA mismatch repair protein MutS2
VRTPGGTIGRLLALPDRRGRVFVQVAGSKLSLDRDRLGAVIDVLPNRSRPDPTHGVESISTPPPGLGGVAEVDLRGLRVDDALERLAAALDLAAAEGRGELRIVHGIGTGALRKAVREELPRSPYVIEWHEAERDQGGAGATRAMLRKD